MRKLTGVPVNYLITVNFRGFTQVVDKLGGIWMDVDRRYYNSHSGPTGYATINLQPGYQKLNGYQALDFVRFRHTDSDLYRNARQQSFVRALKDQVRTNFSLMKLPKVIKALTSNIEVAQGGGKDVSAKTVLSYAVLAYSLPPGHVFQSRIEGLEGYADLTTSQENIAAAVREWANPDVESPKKATAVALGEKVKTKAPPAKETTRHRAERQRRHRLGVERELPARPARLPDPDAAERHPRQRAVLRVLPHQDLLRSQAEGRQAGGDARWRACSARPTCRRRPPAIRALANDAMLTAVVGQTFHGTLAAAPVDQTPKRQPANVVPGASASLDLLRERQKKVDFPLMVPTVLERSSWIDRERPIRLYRFDDKDKHKTVRLTYRMGSNDYWGVQESNWENAPVLGSRNFVRNIGGRSYELFYNGPHLHMVVLKRKGATYWVVNTLLDRLSNETMLAIAKGLRPVDKVPPS